MLNLSFVKAKKVVYRETRFHGSDKEIAKLGKKFWIRREVLNDTSLDKHPLHHS
jgi:hypothetical protein